MRRLLVACGFAALLALAACGGGGSSGGGGNTIAMGGSSFDGNTTVTIAAGQSVVFSDPSGSGGTHILVTGSNGTFQAATGAPSEFSGATGVNFSPGDSKTIVFSTAGTYPITCKIHPSMQATITVT
ncbi:MAG: hypothetical protein IVW57_07495 [Ktedonobacterales bacterium]|nr:hypothetical protein [Ktedonobacterales bacterium]